MTVLRCLRSTVLAAIVLILAGGCSSVKRSGSDRAQEAEGALARGDTSRAVKLLKKNVESPDATPHDYATLGSLYRLGGSITRRQRSQLVLERGLAEHPDDSQILTELGKTYYAQTFYGDAERCFSRVLELDGDPCDAHYYLGLNAYRKWKHVQSYDNYLYTTLTHMRSVMRCAPEKTDAHFMFAFSSYVLGDTNQCVVACERYLERHPPFADILFLLGTVSFERADFEAAWEFFNDGLATLDEDERQNYLDIGLLIFGDEKEAYDWASKDERKDISRVYWVHYDPDPTTPINERLLEHLYRTYLAEALFAMPKLKIRGWDAERGKAIIKFGKPTNIRSTLESRDFHDGRTEIWSYLNAPNGQGFILYFRDEYLNGNYMVPMDYAYSIAGQTLYKDPATTETAPDITPVPGALDVLAFRESSLASKVYLAFAVDADSLGAALLPWRPDSYVVRAAFYDSDGRPQSFHADTLAGNTFPVPPRPAWRRYEPYSFLGDFELPFHIYTVAFSLEDDKALAQALLWAETNTVRFLSDDLTLSDVLLWHKPSDPELWPLIVRPGGSYIPNPRREYAHDQKLRLFFEIYNLSLPGQRSDYEIAYSIFAAERPASPWIKIGRGIKWLLQMDTAPSPVISQTFQRTGSQHQAAEELAIDIELLEPGDYVLTVEVNDKTSGDGAASSKPFTKLSAPSE
jgi:GWxTD domain-containing protein